MISKGQYDALGFAGGVIIAVGLLPQILKTIWTRSAIDISYSWQGIYALGICISLIYAYGLRLYPLAVPLTLELAFVLTLVVLKVSFDRRSFQKAALLSDVEETGQSDGEGGEAPSPTQPPEIEQAPNSKDFTSSPLVTKPSGSVEPMGIEQAGFGPGPFTKKLNFAQKRKAQQRMTAGENATWHGGSRFRPNEPILRSMSLTVEESGNGREGTWHGAERAVQMLGSMPATRGDEELGRGSPRVVVRVINAESPLQRWL